MKDYLPTKFEASAAKCSGDRHPTDGPTDMCNAICPPLSKGGIINVH